MRKPIIAGNWKMNKTLSEAVSFVEEVEGQIPAASAVDAVVCSPALFLERLVAATEGTGLTSRCTKHALRKKWCIHWRN